MSAESSDPLNKLAVVVDEEFLLQKIGPNSPISSKPVVIESEQTKGDIH